MHRLHETSEAVKDWIAAGAAGAGVSVSLADLNVYLTFISLVLAILIAGLRLRYHWRHRNGPPPE